MSNENNDENTLRLDVFNYIPIKNFKKYDFAENAQMLQLYSPLTKYEKDTQLGVLLSDATVNISKPSFLNFLLLLYRIYLETSNEEPFIILSINTFSELISNDQTIDQQVKNEYMRLFSEIYANTEYTNSFFNDKNIVFSSYLLYLCESDEEIYEKYGAQVFLLNVKLKKKLHKSESEENLKAIKNTILKRARGRFPQYISLNYQYLMQIKKTNKNFRVQDMNLSEKIWKKLELKETTVTVRDFDTFTPIDRSFYWQMRGLNMILSTVQLYATADNPIPATVLQLFNTQFMPGQRSNIIEDPDISFHENENYNKGNEPQFKPISLPTILPTIQLPKVNVSISTNTSNLQKNLNVLNKSVKQLKNTETRLQEETQKVERKFEEAKKKLEEIEKELAQKQTNKEFDVILRQLEEEKTTITQSQRNKSEQVDKLRIELQELREKEQQNAQNKVELEKELKMAQEQRVKIKTEQEQLITAIRNEDQTIREITRKIATQKDTIESKTEKLGELEKQLKNLTEKNNLSRDMQEIQEKISEKKENIKSKETETLQLKKEFENLAKQIENKNKEILQMTSELKNKTTELENKSLAIETKKQEISTIEKSIIEKSKEIDRLDTNISKMEKNLQQGIEIEGQRQELATQLQKLVDEKASKEASIKQLLENKKQVNEQILEINQQKQDLELSLGQVRQEKQDKTQNINSMKAQLQQKSDVMNREKSEINRLQREFYVKEKALQTLQSEVSSRKKVIESIEKETVQGQTALGQLESLLKEKQEKKAQQEKLLAETKVKLQKIQSNYDENVSHTRQVELQIRDHEREKIQTQQTINEIRRQSVEESEKLIRLQNERKLLEAEIETQKIKEQELLKTIQDSENLAKQFEVSLQRQKDQLDGQTQMIAESQNKISELEDVISEKTREYTEYLEQFRVYDSQGKEVSVRVQALQENLQRAQQNVQNLDAEKSRLEKLIEEMKSKIGANDQNYQRLQQEYDEINKKGKEALEILEQGKVLFQQNQADLERVLQQRQEMVDKITQQQQELSVLEQEMETLRQVQVEQTNKIEKLKREILEMRNKQLPAYEQSIEQLQQEMNATRISQKKRRTTNENQTSYETTASTSSTLPVEQRRTVSVKPTPVQQQKGLTPNVSPIVPQSEQSIEVSSPVVKTTRRSERLLEKVKPKENKPKENKPTRPPATREQPSRQAKKKTPTQERSHRIIEQLISELKSSASSAPSERPQRRQMVYKLDNSDSDNLRKQLEEYQDSPDVLEKLTTGAGKQIFQHFANDDRYDMKGRVKDILNLVAITETDQRIDTKEPVSYVNMSDIRRIVDPTLPGNPGVLLTWMRLTGVIHPHIKKLDYMRMDTFKFAFSTMNDKSKYKFNLLDSYKVSRKSGSDNGKSDGLMAKYYNKSDKTPSTIDSFFIGTYEIDKSNPALVYVSELDQIKSKTMGIMTRSTQSKLELNREKLTLQSIANVYGFDGGVVLRNWLKYVLEEMEMKNAQEYVRTLFQVDYSQLSDLELFLEQFIVRFYTQETTQLGTSIDRIRRFESQISTKMRDLYISQFRS
jgi:chromosome segregation ATPase